MIYYKDGEFRIADVEVTYENNGEEVTKGVGQEGKAWWKEVEKKHDHIVVSDFEVVEIPREQQERAEIVNRFNFGEDLQLYVENYILKGVLPDERGHPLEELEKELKETEMAKYLLENSYQLARVELKIGGLR